MFNQRTTFKSTNTNFYHYLFKQSTHNKGNLYSIICIILMYSNFIDSCLSRNDIAGIIPSTRQFGGKSHQILSRNWKVSEIVINFYIFWCHVFIDHFHQIITFILLKVHIKLILYINMEILIADWISYYSSKGQGRFMLYY